MVNITKVTSNYVVKNVNRISHMSGSITGEMKNTGKYYYNTAMNAWQTAGRLSDIKHFSPTKKFVLKIANTLAKTKVKQEHLPTLLGGVGTFSPIPGGTILGYALGKAINSVTKFIK